MSNTPGNEPAPESAKTRLLEAVAAQPPLRIYRDNPFRGLGLSVLASGREIAKRADELRLAQELDLSANPWSFAPAPHWNQEDSRRALQALKDPSHRVAAELFWFWPETYPLPGDDPALEKLQAGETDAAVAIWAGKKSAEQVTVLHNLAVYHHLMALEQEQQIPPLASDDLLSWWGAAVRFWQLAAKGDALWDKLRARIVSLGDAQLTTEAVAPLQERWRDRLAEVNAVLAVRYAEAGNTIAAARHVAILGQLYDDPAAARAAIERGVRPVLQRVNAQLEACAKKMTGDLAGRLAAGRALLVHSFSDIQVLNTLCGSESELAGDLNHRFAVALLDAVSGAEQSPADRGLAFAILSAIRPHSLSSALRARLEQAVHSVIDPALVGAPDGAEPRYALLYRFVTEQVVPGVYGLELGENARRESLGRAVELLRQVAQLAVEERDDIGFALHAYQTLLQLPADSIQWSEREVERDSFHQRFLRRKEKEVQIENEQHLLEINGRGVFWDGATMPLAEITALRHGRTVRADAGAARERFVVAWKIADTEYVLNEENMFSDPATASDLYRRVVEALAFFLSPVLVQRLVREVKSGATLWVGTFGVAPDGVVFEPKSRLWKREEKVGFTRVKQWIEDGQWNVASLDNPRLHAKYSIVDTWNATVIGHVIEALAEEAEASL